MVLLGVAALAFLVTVVITRHGFTQPGREPTLYVDLILSCFLVYAVVGMLILVHRPGNAVGWIVGAIGFFPLLGNLGAEYAGRAHLRPEAHWPLVNQALWVDSWYWSVAFGSLPLLLLLYPDGHPVSRGWRPLMWLAYSGLATLLLAGMLEPSGVPRLPNPYAIAVPSAIHTAGLVLLWVSWPLGALGGFTSLALRYRRARGVERQQVTWLLYGAGLFLVLLAVDGRLPGEGGPAFLAGFYLPPIAIGVALLRYRLYDIDRLVSRTVSYAVLSALLALPYVVVVTGASRLGGSNQLAVALATLAAAAAFNPLRRRIQSRVDRRFNRARYDATRTVEAFTNRLREEIDLQTVRDDLLAVVAQTVQPTSASLWLRGGS
jgi:hypothetical protein